MAKEFASRLINGFDESGKRNDQPSVDLFVVEPEQETVKGVVKERDISAESARDAAKFLGSFPYESEKKVLIIRDAHRLTETAQNTLLKTLEEPPAYAVIILVTHDIGKILPTILSRCQQIRFHLVPAQEIMDAANADSTFLSLSPKNGFLFDLGRPGLVIRSCQDDAEFDEQAAILEKLMHLSHVPLRERLALSEACAANVSRTMRIMMWWVGGLHNRSITGAGNDGVSGDDIRHIETIERLLHDMRRFPSSARLLLDAFFIQW